MPVLLWGRPYAQLGKIFIDQNGSQFLGLVWRTDVPANCLEKPLGSPRMLRKRLSHLPPPASSVHGSGSYSGGSSSSSNPSVPLSRNCDLVVCRSMEAREGLIKCLRRMTGLDKSGHAVPVVGDPWFLKCVEGTVGRKQSPLDSDDINGGGTKNGGMFSALIGSGNGLAEKDAVAKQNRSHITFRNEAGGGIDRILRTSVISVCIFSTNYKYRHAKAVAHLTRKQDEKTSAAHCGRVYIRKIDEKASNGLYSLSISTICVSIYWSCRKYTDAYSISFKISPWVSKTSLNHTNNS